MPYTLLWVPKSGLFFDGVTFTDGNGNTIQWRHEIHIFPSWEAANEAKGKVVAKYSNAKGEVLLLKIVIQDSTGSVLPEVNDERGQV